MIFSCRFGPVTLVNEPAYTFGSADNVRRYAQEYLIPGADHLSSIHGVLVGELPLLVVGASGGASGVHANSAVVIKDELFLAVGDHLVCMRLPTGHVNWATQVDHATCFGVYHVAEQRALFSHGELEIARVSYDGALEWRTSGADIFTEGFELQPDHIEAIDFDGRRYRFAYGTGKEV